MTKILYITYDGLTDPLGQSQILPYIIGVCQKDTSFEFHIISFEKKKRFQQNKNIINNLIQPYKIHWHPLAYTKKPPVLGTIWDIFKLNQKFKHLLKTHDFPIVHCRSYIGPLVVLPHKKHRNNFKFIFDMRGFWPDERIDGGLWNLNNPIYNVIYKYFKQKEQQFLQYADSVISLTRSAKEKMLTWKILNLNAEKITVIPCATDYSHFNPKRYSTLDKYQLKQTLNINKDSFILTYLGSLGTWYLLNEMLDFFNILLKKNPNSIFLFITLDNKNEIIRAADKKGIPKDKLKILFASRGDVPKYLSISDYGIFFIKEAYSKIASSPVKMGEFLSMNIPVITNNIGDNQLILDKIPTCYNLSELNTNTYENVVNSILKSKHNITYSFQSTTTYFSLEEGVNKYHKIYQKLSE